MGEQNPATIAFDEGFHIDFEGSLADALMTVLDNAVDSLWKLRAEITKPGADALAIAERVRLERREAE